MDSSVALLQKASGLERLMAGSVPGIIKDSTVAQISAFLYYEAAVLSKLTTNAEFKNLFKTTIFNQVQQLSHTISITLINGTYDTIIDIRNARYLSDNSSIKLYEFNCGHSLYSQPELYTSLGEIIIK